MNIAHARGWLESVPAFPTRKLAPPPERHLTAEEWHKLEAELPAHLAPMAAFAVASGLRWSNVARLTWDRVDLRRRLAWIPGRQAKGGKPISVPLSSAALDVLRARPRPREGYVFTYKGAPIASPKTAWRKAVVRAGVAPLRWHDLRHTWASWHAMRGTPLDVLQTLGAWRSRDMVQRYAHLAPSYVAKFADNSRPVGRKIGHSRKAVAA